MIQLADLSKPYFLHVVPLQPGMCFIGEQCIGDFTLNPANMNQWCDSSVSITTYVPVGGRMKTIIECLEVRT